MSDNLTPDERVARAAECQMMSTVESHRQHKMHCLQTEEFLAESNSYSKRQTAALESIAACADKLAFLADMLIEGMKNGTVKL